MPSVQIACSDGSIGRSEFIAETVKVVLLLRILEKRVIL